MVIPITFHEMLTMSVMGVPGVGVELSGTLRSRDVEGFRLPAEGWRMAARRLVTASYRQP